MLKRCSSRKQELANGSCTIVGGLSKWGPNLAANSPQDAALPLQGKHVPNISHLEFQGISFAPFSLLTCDKQHVAIETV
jgi:hypothetical protein